MNNSTTNPLMTAWRAPLVQFLVLGLIVFGMFRFFGGTRQKEEKKIVVSQQQIEILIDLWERQWRRLPTQEELDGLIQSFIREEVLYREALAMGLDRDDMVVRRRLAQKIEFLAQDLATLAEPGDQELQRFFTEHPEIFEEPAQITFTHVYVNTDQRGDRSATDAERMLDQLRAGADPREIGDRFMLQTDYLRKSPAEVARHFGSSFADEVFALATNEWSGPIRSGYGLHLVLVEGIQAPFLPEFEQVRREVKEEYLTYRRREADAAFYARLRENYEIVIEQPATEVGTENR